MIESNKTRIPSTLLEELTDLAAELNNVAPYDYRLFLTQGRRYCSGGMWRGQKPVGVKIVIPPWRTTSRGNKTPFQRNLVAGEILWQITLHEFYHVRDWLYEDNYWSSVEGYLRRPNHDTRPEEIRANKEVERIISLYGYPYHILEKIAGWVDDNLHEFE